MPNMLQYNELKNILPHAYPFIMIDRVVDYKEGESLTAVKNITANDWIFTGLAEKSTIVPETILIEAAAQAALVLYHVTKVGLGNKGPKYYLGKADAEFAEQVIIGDQVQMSVRNGKMMDDKGYADIDLSVMDRSVANLNIFYGVVQ